MPWRRSIVAVVCGAGMLQAASVRACFCDDLDVEGPAESAEAVFLGQIVEVHNIPLGWEHERRLTFRVETSWKGVTGTEVGVCDSRICPSGSDVGDELLVFGWLRPEDGVLCANMCGMRDPDFWVDPEPQPQVLDRLYQRIELTEGPDPRYPPYQPPPSARGQQPSLCGVGLPGLALLLAPTYAALATLRRPSGGLWFRVAVRRPAGLRPRL